jgi:hypothetical protein
MMRATPQKWKKARVKRWRSDARLTPHYVQASARDPLNIRSRMIPSVVSTNSLDTGRECLPNVIYRNMLKDGQEGVPVGEQHLTS